MKLLIFISFVLILELNISQAQVNLTPYQPAGWDNKIVLSTVTGTNTSAPTIYSDQTIYLDWAVTNIGSVNITQNFNNFLLIDGVHEANWIIPGIKANNFIYKADVAIGPLSAGSHTFRINVDALNAITETNETDNNYSRTITILPCTVPAKPSLGGPIAFCKGSTESLTATWNIPPVPGATSYTWTLPSGWSGSSTSTSITANLGSNASSGTISVTANNSCGSSTPATLNVRISLSGSQPGEITGPTSVCQGSSYTWSISPVPGATSYAWFLPGWSGTSSSTSITAIAGERSGTIYVQAIAECGGHYSELEVSVNTAPPSQPGTITGSTQVCQGSSQTYSISPVSGATSYTWTLPSGWSGSSTSTSITATAGGETDKVVYISVAANNSCGSSAPRTNGIIVERPPEMAAMSGPTSVCQGSSYTYNISSVIAGSTTFYSLTDPSGWQYVTGGVSGNSASFVLTAGSSGGIISLKAQNSCGSVTSALNVNVFTSLPSLPGTITGSSYVCQGATNTYSIISIPEASSYTWTLPSGWSGSSTSTSIAATAGASGGTISVTANNSCGTSIPRTKSIVMTSIPTVTTSSVSTASSSTATGGGNITSNGGAEVTASGICWSTSPDPTTSDSKTTDGLTIGSFTSTISDLAENVTYYIRAYATNCSGTGYGSNVEYNSSNAVEVIQSDEISVYPNPVSGILNIEFKDGAYKTINIINPQGVLLKTEKVISPRQQLDFSKYEPGLYIIEFVKPGGDTERVRVIKH
jgi:hypothetical protein